MDGGFVKKNKLALACEKQKRTKELLGQVLVKMGLLKAHDIKTPLMIQGHLANLDDAVKIAAGERQLLGVLLVESRKITNKQLDMAIAEQKRSGGHLGETFTRLGMLTEQQLGALLDFQHNQSDTTNINPLRLGELLVSTGHITRKQLAEALQQQEISHKKIGEVLVEAGYLSPSTLQSAFRMQKMLVRSVLASILSLGLSAPAMASRVTLQWNPGSGSGLAGYKVYYSDASAPLEATMPIDVSMQTVAAIDGLDPGKSYKFAVTAYDTEGTESEYSNIVTLEEQILPSVAITAPLNATKVSGVVSVNVTASDNVGVAKVEFYVNDVLTATETETASPYSFSWDTVTVAEGAHTLMIKAYDMAGNVSQSSSTVTVTNDIIAPVVTMTAPVNNAILSGTVTISSSASDNVGVNLTVFYCNGLLLYSSNVEPYAYNWDTSTVENGNYSLVAVASDNTGNATQSAPVTVTVNNIESDGASPAMLSFKMPASSTSLTVPVTLLSAKDNTGVTGYLISESSTRPLAGDARWQSTAPTSFTFSSTGKKAAYAWARDAAGNVSASLKASIRISIK